jgi:2-methylcitrate dehydratase PrpD
MLVASAYHIGVVVVPAALAMAEREESNGAYFLGANVAGYEIAARLGRAILSASFVTHFRPTRTVGQFSTALAVARLAALSRDEILTAFLISDLCSRFIRYIFILNLSPQFWLRVCR